MRRSRFDIQARHPRPRLVFKRSNRYLAAQIIDDALGSTLCAASTCGKEYGADGKKNKEAAAQLGQILAAKAQEKGVKNLIITQFNNNVLYKIDMAADFN